MNLYMTSYPIWRNPPPNVTESPQNPSGNKINKGLFFETKLILEVA